MAVTPAIALSLSGVRKRYGDVVAVDDVALEVRAGEVHAIVGENGAGKSTLIKVLCGFYPSGTYGGEIRLRGEEVHLRNLRDGE